MSELIGELTSQPLVLLVMLTSHIQSYWKISMLLSCYQYVASITEFWSEILGDMQYI